MNFDRIARFYSVIESLTTGGRMQAGRVAHLENVRGARRVLIAGEGDGRFLEVCAKALPDAHFTVIDESKEMLRRAADRWNDLERVKFVCANLLEWTVDAPGYDLIVTHFFLDCFSAETLRLLLKKLAFSASPNARWLVADFCEPPSGMARLRAKLTLRTAYAIFRLLANVEARKITSPDEFLKNLDFRLVERKFLDWGMIHSDLWQRKLTND